MSAVLLNMLSYGQVTTYKYIEFYGEDLTVAQSRKSEETKVVVSTSPDDGSIEFIIDGVVHPVELMEEESGATETVKLYKRIGSHTELGTMMLLMTYGKTEDSLSVYFVGKTGTVRYTVY